MNFQSELRRRFAAALAPLTDQAATYAAMVKPAQDSKFGDYQANCAMPLGKQLGNKNTREVAADILTRLDLSDLCEPPEIAGPGFINLKLRDDVILNTTATLFTDERLGVETVTPRRYIVDFSSPNVAKPMHVGHLRSTVIGESICRMLRFVGHQVTADNHIGDWGTQFGMIIYGYKNFLDNDRFQKDIVAELARLYRLVNQLSDYFDIRANLPKLDQRLADALRKLAEPADAKTDPKVLEKQRKKLTQEVESIRAEIASSRKKLDAVDNDPALSKYAQQHPSIAVDARLETSKLHAGDPENLRLWHEFVPACLNAIQGVYDRLDIHFDLALGESYFQPMLAAVVADLEQKNLARESDGAICVFIPGNDAPFIVRKTDGAFTYATTDLATIKYRADKLNAEAILYVVDTRQSEHFKLLFETAKLWGYGNLELKHLNFGTVLGEDGRPIKTRAGDSVGLESLLDEAVTKARDVIAANEGEEEAADKTNIDRIAEIVGLGGIKYADLKHNRESDYIFSWEKMLAKNGDTATYMQYAYARVCGIVRKGGLDRQTLRSNPAPFQLIHPAERALMRQLQRFPEALENAIQEYRPNILAEYLFQTAGVFTTFYENCPVQKAESDTLRTSRLQLCDLTARTLEKGLNLLGIATVEKM